MLSKAGIQEFIKAYKYIYSDPILTEGRNHPLFQAIQTHMKDRPFLKRFVMPSPKDIFFAFLRSAFGIWIFFPRIDNLFFANNQKYNTLIFGSIWLLFELIFLSFKSFYQPNEKYNGIQSIYGHNKVARKKAVELWMTGISAKEVVSILCAERYSVLKKSYLPLLIMTFFLLISILLIYLIPFLIDNPFLADTLNFSSWIFLVPICFVLLLSVPIADQIGLHRKNLQDVSDLWEGQSAYRSQLPSWRVNYCLGRNFDSAFHSAICSDSFSRLSDDPYILDYCLLCVYRHCCHIDFQKSDHGL